jgi:hypothetical protein
MNALSIRTAPDWVAKSLAVLSVAFFWVLPWSPLLAIAALLATSQTREWPRKVAMTGTVLSASLTLAAAIVIVVNAMRFGFDF